MTAAVLVAVSFAAILIVNVIWEQARQVLGLPEQPDYLPLFGQGISGLLVALALGAVVAPLAEEVFFRGYLYAGLRARYGKLAGALGSSVLFAIVHLSPGVLVPILVMGIIFALLYERTGSIWPCIALHSAVNGAAFMGAYIVSEYPDLAAAVLSFCLVIFGSS